MLKLLNILPWWLGWVLWPLSIGIILDGGGSPDPAYLDVSPDTPYNFGSVPVGGNSSIPITVSNQGGRYTRVNSVSVVGAPFSVTGLPIFPYTLNPGDSFTFNLVYTPTAAVVSNDTLTITATAGTDHAPFVGAVSGTGTAATSVSVTPAIIGFPDTKIAVVSTGIVVTVKNNGPGAVTINTIALVTGTQFALSNIAPALPAALGSGATLTFTIKFTPLAAAFFNDTINIGTTANSPAVPVSGQGIQLIPVAICGLSTRKIIFGFVDIIPNVLSKSLDSTNINGLLTSTSTLAGGPAILNGALWNSPGYEKTLRRVQVFYENVGVGSLTCTVSSFRPSISADYLDGKSQTINLGTPLGDLSERSAFFDLQISGEIILMSLTQSASGGPVCIIGFLPLFEDKGEKVEGI